MAQNNTRIHEYGSKRMQYYENIRDYENMRTREYENIRI